MESQWNKKNLVLQKGGKLAPPNPRPEPPSTKGMSGNSSEVLNHHH